MIDDVGKPEVLFLNILVVKIPTEEMKAKVAEKIPNPLGFGVLQGLAAEVVGKLVTQDVVASKLAEKMPQELPGKLAENGIEARAEKYYVKGSYIVVKLIIDYVHSGEVMQHSIGSAASLFQCCYSPQTDKMLKANLASKMIHTLPKKLEGQMAEKGMVVEVIAKKEDEQARFQENVISQLPRSSRSCTTESCTIS